MKIFIIYKFTENWDTEDAVDIKNRKNKQKNLPMGLLGSVFAYIPFKHNQSKISLDLLEEQRHKEQYHEIKISGKAHRKVSMCRHTNTLITHTEYSLYPNSKASY